MSHPTTPIVTCAPPCADQTHEPARWFAEEVHAHDSQLKSYLRGSFPSVHDVEDVVQESYLRVWRARAAEPIKSARAFLFTIARRLALDVVRHRRNSPIDVVPDLAALRVVEDKADLVAVVSAQEEDALLVEALATLPPRCREIIVLRKFQNLPQKEVASRLGISEFTVQEQVYRGLRRLEKILVRRGVMRSWQHE